MPERKGRKRRKKSLYPALPFMRITTIHRDHPKDKSILAGKYKCWSLHTQRERRTGEGIPHSAATTIICCSLMMLLMLFSIVCFFAAVLFSSREEFCEAFCEPTSRRCGRGIPPLLNVIQSIHVPFRSALQLS